VVERKGIEVTSRYSGAVVNAMLGNTVGTKYTVEVSSTTLEPVYFNLYTQGRREPRLYDQFKFMGSTVYIGGFELFNENGEPVNAAKAGEELKAPLRTRLFVLHDEYTMEVGTAGSCPDGWRLRSLQTVKIEPASNGIVTYTPVEGGGSVVETTNAGNGFYEVRYETGPNPAVNRVDATGEATVTVPEVLRDADYSYIQSCYDYSILPERKVALKAGQVAVFDDVTKEPYFYYDGGALALDIRVVNTIYGVDFVPCRDIDTCAEIGSGLGLGPGSDIKLDPGVVLVNEEGHTAIDTTLRYTIFPPEYDAVSADIDLYEIDATTGESNIGYIVGSSTQGEGGSILVAGANMFDLDKKYEAQVVLNRGTIAEIKSKRVDVPVAELKFLIDHDGKLSWNDYYPALGSKIITVLAVDKALEGKTVTCISEIVGVTCKPVDDARFRDSKVQFRLFGTNLTESQKTIPLTFQALNDDGMQLASISATYTVKDNSNTTLKEVLAGKAVFVQDCFTENNVVTCESQGEYEPELPDEQKKFYFVQELLNQVVQRKRGVTDDLLVEDGYYGGNASKAVNTFKTAFNINVNTNANNLTDTFRKLMKDYELEGSEGDYFDKIIDKETLVGKVQRTGEGTKDVFVNDGSATDDTGLYELYVNVVVPFVDAMIEEGERYAGLKGAVSDNTAPTDDWTSRTGEGPGQHGSYTGMSYSFGGKNNMLEFNTRVSQCKAPESTTITPYYNAEYQRRRGYIVTDTSVDSNYSGNINNETNCTVGSGTDPKKYVGLYRSEWLVRQDTNNMDRYYQRLADGSYGELTDRWSQFLTHYWAGIDCSGFSQRVIHSGRNVVEGVNISIPIPSSATWINAASHFTDNRVHYMENPTQDDERLSLKKQLRKGDLVRYGNSHISIVYSDRPACTEDKNGDTTCSYEIIHAYGGDDDKGMYRYPDIPEAAANRNKRVFGRKVIKTWNNIADPTGFGRLKLWN